MNYIEKKLQRLQELRKRRPQYVEIYDFYNGLCRFMQQQDDWISYAPDFSLWEQHRQNGFPLLTSEALQVSPEEAKQFFGALIDTLVKLGREGDTELGIIAGAIDNNRISIETMVIACLEKDRAPFEMLAEELSVPAALLEYVCSTALSFSLQRWQDIASPLPLDTWREGYCPVCGGVPLMGELAGEEGEKRLHCSLCATRWNVTRLKCSYCGNAETDSLEYFTAEGEIGYRVDICRKCSSYLKVIDSRELGEDLPMDVEDLNTMHLDLMAQKEGFAKGKRTLDSQTGDADDRQPIS